MTDLFFADTNLLVYALDPAHPAKRLRARDILVRGIQAGVLVTSPQSMHECYRVLTAKKRLARDEAVAYVRSLFPTCRASYGTAAIERAWQIEAATGYAWWDALLLAAALLAGCATFLSEDLGDGHVIDGLRIANHYAFPVG